MGAMGSTDRTYDAEFESHCKHFKALYEDMNECKWKPSLFLTLLSLFSAPLNPIQQS
jgi:hypothetical protein